MHQTEERGHGCVSSAPLCVLGAFLLVGLCGISLWAPAAESCITVSQANVLLAAMADLQVELGSSRGAGAGAADVLTLVQQFNSIFTGNATGG